jgi:hypothetical protein
MLLCDMPGCLIVNPVWFYEAWDCGYSLVMIECT